MCKRNEWFFFNIVRTLPNRGGMRAVLGRVAAVITIAILLLGSSTELLSQSIDDTDGQKLSKIIQHRIDSSRQSAPTVANVLCPDNLDKNLEYRVLYVLPVEAGEGTRWGDGLKEIQQQNLHNQHNLICVASTFAALPWYADHPSDSKLQQESYFIKDVLPLIEENYPVSTKPEGRLLLGFSKSGVGAFTLLLRNPDLFDKAAAWDAPLNMPKPGQYGSGPIYGGDENFQNYHIQSLLEKFAKEPPAEKVRLIHLGYDNFRQHHQQTEATLHRLKIPHIYKDGPKRKHHWNSGWVKQAVELLTQGNQR